jgi:hypothetical protein
VVACGPPRRLAFGRQDVLAGRGALRIDHLRMRARRPAPVRTPPGERADGARSAGAVLSQGDDAGRGRREDARIDVDRPAWVVLGQGYNRGWRATCDGRDLGEPVPMQGYANAWPVDRGCRDLDFAWAPNGLLLPAYAISLLGALGLIVLVLVAGRRRTPATQTLRAVLPDPDPPAPWPWRRAIAAGVLAGVVLAFVFAIRAGIVLGPAVAVILARGIGARPLALAGGALLAVVVPLLYLVVPVRDPGGFNTNLAVERIAAHWVGVAAVFLLGAALWRTLAAARAAHPDRRRLPGRRRRVRPDPA